MFPFLSFSSSAGKNAVYLKRKGKKSENPVAAFFQKPAGEQKKAWKIVIRDANEMQRKIIIEAESISVKKAKHKK